MFAVGAVERVFGDVELAEGAGSQLFSGVVSFDWATGDALDSGFEFWRDLVNIFGSD